MKNQNLLKLLLVVGLALAAHPVYGQDYEVDPTFNRVLGFQGSDHVNTFEITDGGRYLLGANSFPSTETQGRGSLA